MKIPDVLMDPTKLPLDKNQRTGIAVDMDSLSEMAAKARTAKAKAKQKALKAVAAQPATVGAMPGMTIIINLATDKASAALPKGTPPTGWLDALLKAKEAKRGD